MYNSIAGLYRGLLMQGSQTFVLIDQQGLEWMLEASRNTLSALPRIGDALKLLVYLQHTEDSMNLFGFASTDERQVFMELLKVQGIGPRAAIKILSGTTPNRLRTLLENEDLAGLEQIPGLGKKTSQKVLLTLKGKLVLQDSPSVSPSSGPDEDIVLALVAMGFERRDSVREVTRIALELGEMPKATREQELLRRCIMALS